MTGLRERVRKAIEGPVGKADELLAEVGDVDAAAKLEILISGWGRGVAAALEELAIAVEDLQARQPEAREQPAPPEREPRSAPTEPDESAGSPPADRSRGDEEQLLDEARRSRDETAEVREQADELRGRRGEQQRPS